MEPSLKSAPGFATIMASVSILVGDMLLAVSLANSAKEKKIYTVESKVSMLAQGYNNIEQSLGFFKTSPEAQRNNVLLGALLHMKRPAWHLRACDTKPKLAGLRGVGGSTLSPAALLCH